MQGRRFERLVAVTPCPHLMHLGSAYGGYVIPADLPDSSWVAYCGGVGEDGSFEIELARRYRCRVVAFDPTPRSIRYAERELVTSGVTFLPYGLWSEDSEQRFYEPRRSNHVSHSIENLQGTEQFIVAPVRSLESSMRELGDDRVNLLKLDIEGAEYAALQPVVEERFRVDVLCLDLHPTPSFDMMHRFLQRLEAVRYRVVHCQDTRVTLLDARHLSSEIAFAATASVAIPTSGT